VSQLALPLKLSDHAVFDSFYAADNETVVAALEALADSRQAGGAWIWGSGSTGKTHLLQAVCARVGDEAMYVPMRDFRAASPGLLDGLETRSVLCLDDLDAVAGMDAWERALFRLYNALVERGQRLLIATTVSPTEAEFRLPDLESRLRQLPVFRLAALDDAERAAALRLRARHRGLELPEDTASYLLKRSRRDMKSLYALLDTLDSAALSQQRRLTVPFVRDVLDASPGSGAR
jgi:DnaA family protein